jgi:hypothetical protein
MSPRRRQWPEGHQQPFPQRGNQGHSPTRAARRPCRSHRARPGHPPTAQAVAMNCAVAGRASTPSSQRLTSTCVQFRSPPCSRLTASTRDARLVFEHPVRRMTSASRAFGCRGIPPPCRINAAVLPPGYLHSRRPGIPPQKAPPCPASGVSQAPRHVCFGWKNFFVKDHPMLTPAQAMARSPQR